MCLQADRSLCIGNSNFITEGVLDPFLITYYSFDDLTLLDLSSSLNHPSFYNAENEQAPPDYAYSVFGKHVRKFDHNELVF